MCPDEEKLALRILPSRRHFGPLISSQITKDSRCSASIFYFSQNNQIIYYDLVKKKKNFTIPCFEPYENWIEFV